MNRHMWDGTAICYPKQDRLNVGLSNDMGVSKPPDLPVFQFPSEEQRWFLCDEGRFAATIRSQLDLMTEVQTPRQPPPHESDFSGQFRTLLWPGILAFALALRLTKVVADLTKWAPERYP
jgi:hypothetical protein